MINRKTPVLLFILLLLSTALFACGNKDNSDLAPMFELSDLDGENVSLESLSGEKVYLKYWASWCSICLAGLEELDQLSAEKLDFKVITIVSPEYKGEMNQNDFKEWFKDLGYKNIKVLIDTDGVWSQKFGVLAYPDSYYIGSDGSFVKHILGHNPNDIIKSEMAQID